MRVRSNIVNFFARTATIAMLAGCSGGGGGFATPATPGASSLSVQESLRPCGSTGPLGRSYRYGTPSSGAPASRPPRPFLDSRRLARTTNAIAVAAANLGVVDLFDSNFTPIGELTGFNNPDGLASDKKGDLYVADSYNDRVAVYAAGFASPPTFLNEPGFTPSGVDSYGNGAVVAVANFGVCNAGSVGFFVGGVLTKTIVSPLLGSAYFCAFDAAGNLYVDGRDSNGASIVGEIVGGVKGKKFSPLTTTNTFGSAVGIQVTTTGQIAIADQAGAIYTYARPVNGSLGAPLSTTVLSGSSDPVGFAFTRDGTSAFVGDFQAGALEQYAYPAGGAILTSLSMSAATVGVAVIPTQVPKH